jgi:predicted dehydrogenase
MDKIRVGVVGAGFLGRHHAEVCAANDLAQVAGVADPRLGAARDLAQKVGAKPYGSAKEMFDAEKIAVAVIATPDNLHKDPFLEAIDAGVRAIILEKPLATTNEDADEMMLAADKATARVFVNFANRFATLFMATHRVVQEGFIGKPVFAESTLDDNISVPYRLWGDRSREWAAGSSTAQFLFPHIIDLLHWVFAPARIEAVHALKQQVVLGFTPDLYDAYLYWDNGLKSRIKAEWVKHIEPLVEFYLCLGGTTGSVIARRRPGYGATEGWRAMVDSAVPEDKVQAVAKALADEGLAIKSQMIPDPTCNGEKRRGYLELEKLGERSDTDLYLQAVAEDTDTPSNWQGFGPLPTGEDGLRAVRVVSAIVQSAETGETVKVPGF